VAGILAGLLLLREAGPWFQIVALVLPLTPLLAFLCLAAWYPCRAHPLTGTDPLRLVLLHGLAAVTTTSVWLLAAQGWSQLAEKVPGFQGLSQVVSSQSDLLVIVALLLYLLATAAHYVFLAQEAGHAERRRALELEVATREAEIKALRSQLDPHFLFNSLHSVAALCGSNPEGARSMIERLASFFRTTLEVGKEMEITLAQELDLASSYLEIERLRFGDRLAYVVEADSGAESTLVPPLLLQPLVENAVRHGTSQLLEGGSIHIRAVLSKNTLVLAVENPCDPQRKRQRGTGTGLSNLQHRLAAQYGSRASVQTREDGKRYTATLRLPQGRPEAR
jgi:sensor histidine kinase YesM